MKGRLPYHRDLYHLWFEYLRLARSSSNPDVKAALERSAEFYAPWDMVDGVGFSPWWKTHRKLFEDTETVRRLEPHEMPLDPNILVVQIPLTQSATELARRVKSVIQEAFKETYRPSTKSKKRAQSKYHLTAGAEPKVQALVDSILIYRVRLKHRLKHPGLRGQAFLDKVREFYVGRKDKELAKVPGPLSNVGYNGEARAQRNLLRYVEKAESIMLNVAKGEFPGKY